ncbi:MAG TPA: SIR2 family protein [Gemmatimonadaceae bacterium]|nr:SIR2 family protein [Gemmatimonadaceae bacterium]
MNAEAAELLTNPRDRLAFQHLERLVQSGDALAMIGAGCSARMGYPAWGALLNHMHDRLSQRHGEGAQSGRESLRRHDDMLWRAEEYRRLLGPDYGQLLTEQFSCELAIDDCIKDIVALPFRHMLTTNYDTSLERAHSQVRTEELHRVDWGDEPAVLEFLYRFFDPSYGRQYVYLHGRINNLDNVVFTDDDYTTRYLRSEGTVKRLFALFALQKMVFFGFSLTDPDLMAILRQVNVAVGFTEPRHVALVGLDGTEDREIHRGRLIKKFGINPVFYDRRDNHIELAVFARSLVECCSRTDGVRPRNKEMSVAAEVGGLSISSSSTAAPPPAPVPSSAVAPPSRKSAPMPPAAAPMASPTFGPPSKRPSDLPENPADPEDPQRGRFGGEPERGRRRLSATLARLDTDWFAVNLLVESTGQPELTGKVFFYLHDSFLTPVLEVVAQNGRATARVECYGAFTVGVYMESEPENLLEYCLSGIEGAPLQFVMS